MSNLVVRKFAGRLYKVKGVWSSRREVNQSPPSSVAVKNDWNSNPPIRLYGVDCVKFILSVNIIMSSLNVRFFVCFWRNRPPVGQGLLIHEVSRSHTTTHHSR
jgi:hypothetical protein